MKIFRNFVGNGSFLGDSPEKAESASLDLVSGDIIVLATDGLWDNVTEGEIVKQLSGLKPGDVQVRLVFNSYVQNSYRFSWSNRTNNVLK